MPSIDLISAEAEFAQGHFPKSHAQNVPMRKSLWFKANAQKMSLRGHENARKMRACPLGDRDTSAHFSLYANVPALRRRIPPSLALRQRDYERSSQCSKPSHPERLKPGNWT